MVFIDRIRRVGFNLRFTMLVFLTHQFIVSIVHVNVQVIASHPTLYLSSFFLLAETSGMPKKKGVSFSNLNAGSNSISENSSGRISPSKQDSNRKPRKHASFSVRDVEDDSASDQDVPSPNGKGKDKKLPSFPDDDEYEPDFYEEKQPQSLLESLGMAQDDQRMNVVLASKIDANDKAAAHELSKMYISPVPRTGILNK